VEGERTEALQEVSVVFHCFIATPDTCIYAWNIFLDGSGADLYIPYAFI
jgi:hypothetical protein